MDTGSKSFVVGALLGGVLIFIGILLVDKDIRKAIKELFMSVYLRFLARLVIRIIKKHFAEGLTEYNLGKNKGIVYFWKWTKEFEDMIYRRKIKEKKMEMPMEKIIERLGFMEKYFADSTTPEF